MVPLGNSKTSPVSAVDVAEAVSAILDNPAPHIGKIYNLTGFEFADLDHYAQAFSEALGRTEFATATFHLMPGSKSFGDWGCPRI